MLEFLTQNAGTILVAAVLALVLILAFLKIRKDKKNGKGCGCGCSGCPSQGICSKAAENPDKK